MCLTIFYFLQFSLQVKPVLPLAMAQPFRNKFFVFGYLKQFERCTELSCMIPASLYELILRFFASNTDSNALHARQTTLHLICIRIVYADPNAHRLQLQHVPSAHEKAQFLRETRSAIHSQSAFLRLLDLDRC